MLIRTEPVIASSEITDEKLYVRRREFIRLMGTTALVVGTAPLLQACSGEPVAADFAGSDGPAVPPGQTPLPNIKPKVVTTD